MHVTAELNDRGRVALVDSLGGSVDRVEGIIHTANDSSLVVRVAAVQFLNGQVSKWTNEPVTIRREHTRDVRERRFSRSRTVLVSAGVVGALVAFVTGIDLFGSGIDGKERPGPPEPPSGQ
jgi:hypothetical protein